MAIQFVGFPEEVLAYVPDMHADDDLDFELDPDFKKIIEEDIRNGKFDNPIESISGEEIGRIVNERLNRKEEQPAPVSIPEQPKFSFPEPDRTIRRTSNIYRKSGS